MIQEHQKPFTAQLSHRLRHSRKEKKNGSTISREVFYILKDYNINTFHVFILEVVSIRKLKYEWAVFENTKKA